MTIQLSLPIGLSALQLSPRLGLPNHSHSRQKEIWQKGTYFMYAKIQTHNCQANA